MCPRRPSCPRLTARRATPPTPQPSHPGWGRARAWRSLRRGRWIARPFAGSPPPNTATGLACDHRAAFTHAAQLWQAEHVAWCAVAVVTTTRSRWCHPAWLCPAATALMVLASANHLLLDAVGGLAAAGLGVLATSRSSQLTRRPTGGSTVARKHKRWETQISVTPFSRRATDSVTFAGGGKRRAFPQCREEADHD